MQNIAVHFWRTPSRFNGREGSREQFFSSELDPVLASLRAASSPRARARPRKGLREKFFSCPQKSPSIFCTHSLQSQPTTTTGAIMTTNLPPIPPDEPINESTIIQWLLRLFAHCEQHGLDLDLLFNEARHTHSGEPDVQESG
jgi:hypothetical protein